MVERSEPLQARPNANLKERETDGALEGLFMRGIYIPLPSTSR